MYPSPLRYPGGKQKLAHKILPLILPHVEYREPFLGGAGMALSKPTAQVTWLNDIDEDVTAFWCVVRGNPDALCELILQHQPDLKKWHRLTAYTPKTELQRAYKFLFLNRTSYSGIVGAKPIGGLQQNGVYKITARWDPTTLCAQIKNCAEKLARTKITTLDFADVIAAPGSSTLLYCDPPYYEKGNTLYTHMMSSHDHTRLMELLRVTPHKFVLSYDNAQKVRELYKWANIQEISANHSVVNKGNKTELVITNF